MDPWMLEATIRNRVSGYVKDIYGSSKVRKYHLDGLKVYQPSLGMAPPEVDMAAPHASKSTEMPCSMLVIQA